MKTTTNHLAAILAVFAAPVMALAAEQGPAQVNDRVDWAQFLARQDPVWNKLPASWPESPFVGNGLLGLTIHGDKTTVLRWNVGRTDVTDHRKENTDFNHVTYDQARLPIGHFELAPAGNVTNGTMRLDLWNAEITGVLETDRGRIESRSFAVAEDPVMVVEFKASAGERDFKWTWVAEESASTRRFKGRLPRQGYKPNPPAHEETAGDIKVCVQPLPVGGGYATAWREIRPSADRRLVFISVGNSWRVINGVVQNGAAPDAVSGTAEAVEAVKQAMDKGVEKLVAAHRQWWHAYYPQSFVSIPDPRMESFYWIQMYKLASATRADRPAIDLLGPWFTTTLWPAFWCDLNLQLTYYPVYTANRLELGESLCRMLDANFTNLIHNANEELWSDGAGLGNVSSFNMVSPGGVGNLVWLCHDYWKQCRYGADDARLREHLLPLLRRCVNVYLHMLTKGADGKLHLPRTFSPEYGRAEDCNYDLSLLRWGCRTLVAECTRLKIADPLLPKWQDVLADLTDYPTGPNGFMIGRDMPLAKAHRHYSHLLMIYPLHLVDWEQPRSRAVIEKSVEHWAGMPDGWAGFAYAGAAAMYASMGRGDKAVQLINDLLEYRLWEGAYISPNTMYIEGRNPVMETPLAAASSIQDMLLQSWGSWEQESRIQNPEVRRQDGTRNPEPETRHSHPGGYVSTIRVFPGVPGAWKEAAFHNLRAEGAFLVSAVRKDGRTQWVRVKNLAGWPCRIKPALAGEVRATVPVRKLADGAYELDLDKGGEAFLYAGDRMPACEIAPVPVDPAKCNYYGSTAAALKKSGKK